ncbi:MAG TPA: hypothetical protein VM692_15040, partial [Gammaproteobacteria bacterium]|nr:hypothetical protein [Gammaproteobacteria bacterium]
MSPLRDASRRFAGRILNRGAAHATLLFDVTFWLGAALFAVELARRSITLGDEGYLMNQSLDLASGKVPYRDFDLFVTPGAWLLNALVFTVFGPSIVVTRYVAALSLVAAMAVAAGIVRETLRADLRRPSRGRWSRFAAALTGMLAVWAFPAWTISFYSPYATLAAMTGLL